MATLPIEVCALVVQHARPADLLSLARVSQALQVLAESLLYTQVVMRDNHTASNICLALGARGGFRAAYVRRFWLWQDPRLRARGPMPIELWGLVRDILPLMVNLKYLYINDDTYTHTWIFDADHIGFQLHEANMVFSWDDSFVSFLEGQSELHTLTLNAPDEEDMTRRTLSPGSLPNLTSFEGPLFPAVDMLACPLKRLSIRVDEDNAPLYSAYVTELARVNTSLRSLNVQHMPEYLVADSLRVLGASPLSGTLRYLGILCLPSLERHDVHRSLVKFGRLEAVQVDLSHWNPLPMPCHLPMVASELRTYCSSIRYLVVYVNANQFFGRCENERWHFQQVQNPRHYSPLLQWREY